MPESESPYDLERFLSAQAPIIESAIRELESGRKRGHWMWFVFPQLKGLGRSSTSAYYGLSGLAEAKALAQHPALGPRLCQCVRAALASSTRSAEEIFGAPDWMKFRSCLTLFARTMPEEPCFRDALNAFFAGEDDAATVALLSAESSSLQDPA